METNYVEGWKAQTEYCGAYNYGGRKWCLNIFAVDDADAELRMRCIRESFVVLGKLEGVIPVGLGPGQPVADAGDQVAAGAVQGDIAGRVFKPFQELADGWHGNMLVLHQEADQGSDHLSRSCAMRVDGVTEMVRVLQVFFKL